MWVTYLFQLGVVQNWGTFLILMEMTQFWEKDDDLEIVCRILFALFDRLKILFGEQKNWHYIGVK